MNKDSVIDYCSCILLKVIGPVIRRLPLNVSLFLGRRLGELFYYFDFKHKAVAYANIKTAFAGKLSPPEVNKAVKGFYRAFGQHFIEIFLIPLIDKAYIDRYVQVEGFEHINEAFKRGKGVILLGMHEGSWELSNIVSANFDFAYNMFVRQQKYPRLGKLLDAYRTHKGCRIIQRESELRHLVRLLKDNQAVGMSIDQGGRDGCTVKFFGKSASMSIGAVKVALKYDAAIVPVFSARVKGPYIKFIIEPPFNLRRSIDFEKDAQENLQELVRIFERHIAEFPQEYLWTYKIWKYAKERNILILGDTKTGHLRQAQALAKIVKGYYKDKEINVNIDTVEVKFRNRFLRHALDLCSCLCGKYHCQGCLCCLKKFLKDGLYAALIGRKPDIIISCGSSLAAVNYILSRENNAASIAILRPSFLSTNKFDLAVMPKHDNPAKRKNVVEIEGALNLIDDKYLKGQAEILAQRTGYGMSPADFRIGLLIGGDAKKFRLEEETMSEIISQIKTVAEKLNATLLITTSRRTSKEIEGLVRKEFNGYPRCKLLVIANENNIPEAVGGILGLSQVVVITPESISMISEAVSSQKYVLVFKASGLSLKHRRFLAHFSENKYIYSVESVELGNKIEELYLNKPKVNILKDNFLVSEAVKKIL